MLLTRQRRAAGPRPGTLRSAGLIVLLCVGLAGCDLSWEERAEQAFAKAMQAQDLGDYERATDLLRQALKDHPYHPGANLRLAEIYDQRLFHQKGAAALAIYYYERYLDLDLADKSTKEQTQSAIAALEKIRGGELEDPADAVEDFLNAARANQMRPFGERLNTQLVMELHSREISAQQYLTTWTAALEGRVVRLTYRLLDKIQAQFRAFVTVDIVGGKSGAESRVIHLSTAANGKTWEIAGYETSGGSAASASKTERPAEPKKGAKAEPTKSAKSATQ